MNNMVQCNVSANVVSYATGEVFLCKTS